MNATTPMELLHAPPSGVRSFALESAHRLRDLEKLPEGLDAMWLKAHGWIRRLGRRRKLLEKQADLAEQYCGRLADLTDDELADRLAGLRGLLRRDPLQAKGQLAQALGAVGQMAERVIGHRPYKVQYWGALAMHAGCLAEMATGEGKTLTVALAAILSGFTGRPCHVITANDYLAERDAQTMIALFDACKVSVASITATVDHDLRPALYLNDVVYVTEKELLADYLRTTLVTRAGQSPAQKAFEDWIVDCLQAALRAGGDDNAARPTYPPGLLGRGLHTVIVDEADSVLIDEAVTPLILAAPRESRGLPQAAEVVSHLAQQLTLGADYERAARGKTVTLLTSARQRLLEVAHQIPEVWRPAARREELLRQALVVREFFFAGKHYVVDDGEVVLLDEFTGRLTPGRTLTAGLHQAIEAKEGLEITAPNESMTQMSFQSFFRRFRRMGGCTGTAIEAYDELWAIYGLQVMPIPTHRPRQTRYLPAVLHQTQEEKWQAVAQEALALQGSGRPVLIGVRSVISSALLAEKIQALGLCPSVLNALSHADEAEIIAKAGQRGAVTIATNMAGRGTDIKLGEGVVPLGGLHVIVAEINESKRIDRQLAGRCGRQGDPGSVSVHLSLADDLAVAQIPKSVHRLLLRPQAARWAPLVFRWAQWRAEARAYQRRVGVLRNDDWLASALPFHSGPSKARVAS